MLYIKLHYKDKMQPKTLGNRGDEQYLILTDTFAVYVTTRNLGALAIVEKSIIFFSLISQYCFSQTVKVKLDFQPCLQMLQRIFQYYPFISRYTLYSNARILEFVM
jgi:hypothetical protein